MHLRLAIAVAAVTAAALSNALSLPTPLTSLEVAVAFKPAVEGRLTPVAPDNEPLVLRLTVPAVVLPLAAVAVVRTILT
jgi:hypothetical protein